MKYIFSIFYAYFSGQGVGSLPSVLSSDVHPNSAVVAGGVSGGVAQETNDDGENSSSSSSGAFDGPDDGHLLPVMGLNGPSSRPGNYNSQCPFNLYYIFSQNPLNRCILSILSCRKLR